MKKTKTLVSVLLIGAILLSFCACGKKNEKVNQQTSGDGRNEWVFCNQTKIDAMNQKLDSAQKINADTVFSSLQYEEDMFEGVFMLDDFKNDLKDFINDTPHKDVEFSSGVKNITAVPAAAFLGKRYVNTMYASYLFSDLTKAQIDNVAVLMFGNGEKATGVECSYEVNGNKITFYEIDPVDSVSETAETIEYEKSKAVFEYTFTRRGIDFTLSDGSSSVTLRAHDFTSNGSPDKIMVSGYSLPDTPLVDDLDCFTLSSTFILNYAISRTNGYYDDYALKLDDQGIATLYLAREDYATGEKTEFIKQYGYLLLGQDLAGLGQAKIIFTDGDKVYRYTDDITVREARIMQDDNMGELSEEKLEAIANKKSDLYKDLETEFKNQGIDVVIDRVHGEIAMSATVLFGGDSAVVTDDGKALLDKFLAAYTAVAYNEKYNGFIDKTYVEGHTAPTGGSEQQDIELSQQRADNVKAYCLGSASAGKLDASSLEAVGKASTKPVYGADGEIDMDACRRVSFRFTVNADAVA